MKKFLILSVIVALAGIAAGVAGHGSGAQAVETANETLTTTIPGAVAASPEPAAAASVASKATVTTARRVSAPTTAPASLATPTTTQRVAPTTTTTTAVSAAPSCTLTADYPSVATRKTQRIRFASDMPGAQVTMTMTGESLVTDTLTSGTGSTGQTMWTFVNEAGRATITITAAVQPAGGQMMTNLCSTTYRSLGL